MGLLLSPKVGSKIVDFVVGVMKDLTALHLDRFVHIVRRKITFIANCPVKTKVSAVQERFYLSVAGVSGGDCEMVTLTVLKMPSLPLDMKLPF